MLYLSLSAAIENFDILIEITKDRAIGNFEKFGSITTKKYIEQVVKMLKILYKTTKEFEGEKLPVVAIVLMKVFDMINDLENPEVSKKILSYYFFRIQ